MEQLHQGLSDSTPKADNKIYENFCLLHYNYCPLYQIGRVISTQFKLQENIVNRRMPKELLTNQEPS